MQLVAVTVIGNDRPGIVAAVTKVLYDGGCNLEDVTSTILRGHFSMTLIVQAPGHLTSEDLERGLQPVAGELGLVAVARPVDEVASAITPPSHMVSVYGADRPGILFRVAETLARGGANITDLTSRVIETEDDRVYAVMLEVAIEDPDPVLEALAAIGADLGVEVSVHPIDADIL